ncbi:MAG: DUF192 domain-containing protein [marine benthic group bacterium]|jgi:hypothetical protein|nr:DUF192 domain-containing protein [Gemmatimonadota bacterium]
MIDARTPDRPALRRIGLRIALFSTVVAIPVLTGCGEAGGTSGGDAADQPVPISVGQEVRTAQIRIGGVEVTAEIADNEELRAKGLMNRDSLAENHGMLFVYGAAQVRSFWMRNTRIPLDIAFIDANGVIINIEPMEPQSDENYYSQGPMMYALEMDQGWFEANGVGPGDRLEF